MAEIAPGAEPRRQVLQLQNCGEHPVATGLGRHEDAVQLLRDTVCQGIRSVGCEAGAKGGRVGWLKRKRAGVGWEGVQLECFPCMMGP